MRIYIAHSKDINYIEDLYKPLRNDSFFKNHELILPHETDINSANTREFYKTIDVFIADCTEPATGLGIEIGWAYDDNKKIYCISKYHKCKGCNYKECKCYCINSSINPDKYIIT